MATTPIKLKTDAKPASDANYVVVNKPKAKQAQKTKKSKSDKKKKNNWQEQVEKNIATFGYQPTAHAWLKGTYLPSESDPLKGIFLTTDNQLYPAETTKQVLNAEAKLNKPGEPKVWYVYPQVKKKHEGKVSLQLQRCAKKFQKKEEQYVKFCGEVTKQSKTELTIKVKCTYRGTVKEPVVKLYDINITELDLTQKLFKKVCTVKCYLRGNEFVATEVEEYKTEQENIRIYNQIGNKKNGKK